MIDNWKRVTTQDKHLELAFIISTRNAILKDASFDAYALKQLGTDVVIGEDYRVGYFRDGKEYDLLEPTQKATEWCEIQLSNLEAELP